MLAAAAVSHEAPTAVKADCSCHEPQTARRGSGSARLSELTATVLTCKTLKLASELTN